MNSRKNSRIMLFVLGAFCLLSAFAYFIGFSSSPPSSSSSAFVAPSTPSSSVTPPNAGKEVTNIISNNNKIVTDVVVPSPVRIEEPTSTVTTADKNPSTRVVVVVDVKNNNNNSNNSSEKQEVSPEEFDNRKGPLVEFPEMKIIDDNVQVLRKKYQGTKYANYDFSVDETNPKCPFVPIQFGKEEITQCPDEPIYVGLWLLIRDALRPEHRNRPVTFVDVGCNKGYTIAALLETLNLTAPAPSADPNDITFIEPKAGFDAASSPLSAVNNNIVPGFFSREALGLDIFEYSKTSNHLSPGYRHNLAGGCCDPGENNPYHPKNVLASHPWLRLKNNASGEKVAGLRRGNVFIPEVEVFLIDGTKTHMDYVSRFFPSQQEKYLEHMKRTQNPRVTNLTFHYLRRAISNKFGTIQFCNRALGLEDASICGAGETTPVDTLDRLIPAHINTIDFLITDTEGHDFDVMDGARERFFKPGKVGIYVFETHYGPTIRNISSFIRELESWGYTCYIPLQGHKMGRHLSRISPIDLCWDPRYEDYLRGWKNLVCAHETNFPELRHVFRELSTLPKDHDFEWCHVYNAKKKFFDTHPSKNWTWAEEWIGILRKQEEKKRADTAAKLAALKISKTP